MGELLRRSFLIVPLILLAGSVGAPPAVPSPPGPPEAAAKAQAPSGKAASGKASEGKKAKPAEAEPQAGAEPAGEGAGEAPPAEKAAVRPANPSDFWLLD